MRRKILYITVGVVGAAALLAIATWGAGRYAKRVLSERYPPPGRLIDVGGYRLHIHCEGTGSPTIILDAGVNEFSVQWMEIQQRLASHHRVCAYDRAGMGWSDPGAMPRTAMTMIQELHTLLHRAEIPAPYVFVGHSFGGLLSRLYAHQYPGEVAGLVMVDPLMKSRPSGSPFSGM